MSHQGLEVPSRRSTPSLVGVVQLQERAERLFDSSHLVVASEMCLVRGVWSRLKRQSGHSRAT